MVFLITLFSLLNSNVWADGSCDKYGSETLVIHASPSETYTICADIQSNSSFGFPVFHLAAKSGNDSKFYKVVNTMNNGGDFEKGEIRSFIGLSVDSTYKDITMNSLLIITLVSVESQENGTSKVTFRISKSSGDQIVEEIYLTDSIGK